MQRQLNPEAKTGPASGSLPVYGEDRRGKSRNPKAETVGRAFCKKINPHVRVPPLSHLGDNPPVDPARRAAGTICSTARGLMRSSVERACVKGARPKRRASIGKVSVRAR